MMLKRELSPSAVLALIKGESGQGLLEYALILLLIAVAAVAVLGALGGWISTSLLDSASEILSGS